MATPATRTQDPEAAARFLLDTLLTRHPAPQAIEDLIREFGHGSSDAHTDRLTITDGVTDLIADGLIHQTGDVIIASRPATRGRDLAS